MAVIVQELPAANCVPQGLAVGLGSGKLKSPWFTPAIVMPAILRVPLPIFCRVTNFAPDGVLTAWFPKAMLGADNASCGTVPWPERSTTCGVLLASSVMVTVPERLP